MAKARAAVVLLLVLVGAGEARAQASRGLRGALAGEEPGVVRPTSPAAPAPAAPLAANEERFSAAITLRGAPEFRARVKADLEALRRTRTGAALLAALDQAGKPVTIRFGPQDACSPLSEAAYAVKATARGGAMAVDQPGAGAGSIVTVRREDDPCYPPVTSLGHELIHALHNAQGVNLREHDYRAISAGTDNHEEARTIGIGAYAREAITDNALRAELGNRALPRRRSHAGECRL